MDAKISYGSSPIKRLFFFCMKILKSITIEPVVFFYGVAISLSFIVSPSLYIEKVCVVGSMIFGDGSHYDEDICDNLDDGTHNETQAYVQKTYANIQLVTMFVKGVPPIIFALFIGPWSDKFGRKFLIAFPLIGYVLYNLWFLVNVIFYDEMPVEFLMLEVIQFWLGGFMCFWLGIYSYISDISDEKTRTVRIAVVDFVSFTGMAIGSGISADIVSEFGYEAVYISGCILHCLAIAYTLIVVKDSRQIKRDRLHKTSPEDEDDEKFSFLSIFNFDHIKASFGAAFQKRPGGFRHVIIILISLFGMYVFANGGANSIKIQYARAKFQWEDIDTFNKFWAQLSSIGIAFNLVAIGILMPIMTQLLKMNDLSIVAVCIFSSIASVTVILLAQVPELFYLSLALNMFSDVVTVGLRSALTKIVGDKDIGKIFACVGAITALVGLVSPAYQLIYGETYEWHLGFVYCVSSSIMTVMFGLTLYVYFFMKRHEKKNQEKKEQQTSLAILKPSFKKLDPAALEKEIY